MTSRGKNAVRGFETEIEKSREEDNWKRAVELAQQLKARSPQHESLAHFLIGEGKLEAHLAEWPPLREHAERAMATLTEARGYLNLATDDQGKKAGVALDAHLLLGKLHYACADYETALKHYKLAELDTLTEKELPVRSLRIVAESFAIKALCLEQAALPQASRYKQAERDTDMIRSLEISCDLSLVYLQRATAGARPGPTLEAALQRVPLMHIRAGRRHAAIDRYREMLRAEESPPTQALRLTLARQLAEVLMRGVGAQEYRPCLVGAAVAGGGSLLRRRDDGSDGPWKPKKYSALNQFVPRCLPEEVLLSLVVGEAMAARGAVLSQAGEFAAAREHAARNARNLLDLLALAAARWGQHAVVGESLERAMKFSFGCAHVWRQRALAATAAAPAPARAAPAEFIAHDSPGWGAAVRALAVARRAMPLSPQDAALRLVAADTAYHMAWMEEGIEWSEAAMALSEEAGGPPHARACLMAAVGYQMKAQKTNSRVEKEASYAASQRLLLRAVAADGNDHLAFYHLALHYTHQGSLNEAMDACRACLSCRAECFGGLRLAAALWSCACAGRRQPRALPAARLARHHHPAAAWPRVAIAHLQIDWEGAEAALATGAELLSLVAGALLEPDAVDGAPYADLDAASDPHDDTLSARDAASVIAESTGAYRVERALSAASEASAPRPRQAKHHHAKAWITLADICLRLGRVSAAAGCVAEAAALAPYSHLVLYTRGRVLGAGGSWLAARACFQDALAVHPAHQDTMLHLGAAYYELGWLRLAEKWLRAACALAPSRGDAWRRLALVLFALDEPLAAADAAAAALALQPQEPTLPRDL